MTVGELRRLAAYPADEGGDVGMAAQRLDLVIMVAKLLLGQHRVDLGVADAVHRHRAPPAIGARDQMVFVQAATGDHRPAAERAGGMVFLWGGRDGDRWWREAAHGVRGRVEDADDMARPRCQKSRWLPLRTRLNCRIPALALRSNVRSAIGCPHRGTEPIAI